MLCSSNQQLTQIPQAYMNAESGQRSFSPKVWYEMPATIKAAATLATFERRLKSHFLNQLNTQ